MGQHVLDEYGWRCWGGWGQREEVLYAVSWHAEIKEKMSDSRKLAVLAALFVIFGCVASDSHRRMDKVITRCCKSVSSMIPKKIRDEIISYTHQNALDPCVHAIIFQTKNNGKVCTDPNARWVPKKLKELQKQS
ncbi:C-C motif chemokine 8-like isoform X2 [Anguilla rostrata]|uniref:C-C motif chemokine 8-like isoform X2 n=1 Tax=Anguilla rostrata TaxID=7938 RepID=UPI0030CFD529